MIEPDLRRIREVAFRSTIEQRRKPCSHSGADVVGDDVLHHKLVDDDFDFELRARIGDLDCLWLRIETIEDRFHQSEKVGNLFSDFRISFDHRSEIFEMLLNVAREFVGVVRAFGAGEDRAMNALRMTAHRCKREVSSVTDGPETDLVYAEGFSQILEIVGALVGVVTGEIDTLNVAPV